MSWPVVKIHEISELVTKGTTPTTYGMPFTDEGINFIKAEALNGDTSLNRSGFTYVSEDTHNKLARSILQVNDVLLTIAGANVGACGFVTENDIPANTNQAVSLIRINSEKANPRFIYYYFNRPQMKALCLNIGGQSAQPNVNLGNVKNFDVPLPAIGVQNKIVEVLQTYDDLIENNRRRIALLEESARLLYREWFVHLRFPGHETTKIIDGVPEGWQMKPLGDLCKLRGGNAFKTKHQGSKSGDYPFIKVGDMNSAGNSVAITEANNWVEDTLAKEIKAKPFPQGTVVFAKIGEALKQNRVRILMRGTIIDNNMMGAIPNEDAISSALLYSFFSSYDIASHASGAAIPFLTAGVLSKIQLKVPSIEIAKEFETYIGAMLKQITNLQIQLTSTARARDILLPRLMDGRVEA